MNRYAVGEIVKNRREQLNLTQEELCDGICDVSTLSRLENNKHYPMAKTFAALVERLEMPVERFMMLFTQEDFEVQELCDEIVNKNAVSQWGEAQALIKRLETHAGAKERVVQQFIMRTKALIDRSSITHEEFMGRLLAAVRLTIPNFNEEKIDQYLLSNEEVKCITNIAHAHAHEKERRRAIDHYKKLLKVLDKPYATSYEREKAIPPIACSLSKYLSLERRYEEAIEVCDRAMAVCKKRRLMDKWPELTMNKGCSLCSLGQMEEGKRLLELAYCMLLGFEQYALAEKLEVGAQKEYNVTLTSPDCLRQKSVG